MCAYVCLWPVCADVSCLVFESAECPTTNRSFEWARDLGEVEYEGGVDGIVGGTILSAICYAHGNRLG